MSGQALYEAAAEGNTQEVESLFSRGASTQGFVDKDGWYALHAAAANGHVDIVKLFLRKEVKVDIWNASPGQLGKRTPLHCACLKGHVEVCRILLDVGANVRAKDNYGNTPLNMAAYGGHMAIVRLLVEHHNAASWLYNRGTGNRTPAQCARHHGHTEVADYLENVAPEFRHKGRPNNSLKQNPFN